MNRRTSSDRRKNSGGQAILLVTLGLLAMCGMMGLAVDMGWSFFVHKQAQTAADAAALAAVQEGMQRLTAGAGAISAFDCSGGGTGGTQLDCQTAAVNCASVTATSNLNNGCQYALKNGFDWTTSRQNVTMQSNDGKTANLPSTAPGVVNLVYWVTVRTVQTVPQLFSAVISRTEGTVSAVATAAIAASIGPGQFYGMNRKGDCMGWTGNNGVLSAGSNCGIDYIGAPGNGNQTNCGNSKANLCAPAGIILASSCHGATQGCDSVAGDGDGMGSSLTIMGDGTAANDGTVTGTWRNMGTPPVALTPVYTQAATTFNDPTAPNSQPPLVSELTPSNGVYPSIGACGYPGGVVPAGVTLGPYQYYSYNKNTGQPDGTQLTFSGNVTFSKSASGCPDPQGKGVQYTPNPNGITQASSKFPSYIFYGGMDAGSSSLTMGPGQYVMAGTTNGLVFQQKNVTIRGDSATGTMWVFTDGNYPGMADQLQILTTAGKSITAIQSLMQGGIDVKNGDIELSGLIGSANQGSNLPASLNSYSGIAWWQDRRNSDVGYNKDYVSGNGCASATDCSGDDGSVIYCATGGDCAHPGSTNLANMLQANHVTATSPGIVMDPGNGNIGLNGVFYQPRGAWLDLVAGNTGFTCPANFGGGPNQQCPLQVITGALFENHGTASVNLAGPTNPIITYKPVLIH